MAPAKEELPLDEEGRRIGYECKAVAMNWPLVDIDEANGALHLLEQPPPPGAEDDARGLHDPAEQVRSRWRLARTSTPCARPTSASPTGARLCCGSS